MSEPSNQGEDWIDLDLAAAILGANCSTGMAVAVGVTGVGLAAALPVLVVGAVGGILLRGLIGEW